MFYRNQHSMSVSPISHMAIFVYLTTQQEDLEIVRWVDTIQMTALLRIAGILRRVLETWGDLLSLKLQYEKF